MIVINNNDMQYTQASVDVNACGTFDCRISGEICECCPHLIPNVVVNSVKHCGGNLHFRSETMIVLTTLNCNPSLRRPYRKARTQTLQF